MEDSESELTSARPAHAQESQVVHEKAECLAKVLDAREPHEDEASKEAHVRHVLALGDFSPEYVVVGVVGVVALEWEGAFVAARGL